MSFEDNWFVSALIAMCCYAAMALILKHLSGSLEISTILFYLFGLSTLMFGFHAQKQGLIQLVSSTHLAFLLCAAGLAFAGNFYDLQALSSAPNAGYAAAVKAGQIALITIGAMAIFRDQSITLTGSLGLLFVAVGIVLLSVHRGSA